MRVVVLHPATPVPTLNVKDEFVVHLCEHAVPGAIVERSASGFPGGYCPFCHEHVISDGTS